MNYFVEGLQGSGKSTLVRRLSKKYPDYKVICEGDYSPVELAWCAYVDKDTYIGILEKYDGIKNEIVEKSFEEGDHMILFQKCSDQQIVDFYKKVREALAAQNYQIMYLKSDDIVSNIDVVRKERSDDKGNEMWFPLMLGYFNNSPYAKEKGISGTEALLDHFRHMQELELRICKEVFEDHCILLKSKDYSI